MRSHFATICVAATVLVAPLPAAAQTSDTVRPRVLGAHMRDVDADGLPDRIVLRYSEPIRHRRDADGRYPFRIDGYDISLIKAAYGTHRLVVVLEKKIGDPDPSSRPSVHYRHTRQQPVRDAARLQAVEQTFSDVVPLFFELTVTLGGTGSGRVSSAPDGISCGLNCSQRLRRGFSMTLTATPSSGSTFDGWAGACTGSVSDCRVVMNDDVSVAAIFSVPDPGGDEADQGGGTSGGGGGPSGGGGSPGGAGIQTFALSVAKAGGGSGSVSSIPAGIDCGADCSESYAFGTAVTLTATAASGSVFAGWTGDCSGSASTCAVTLDAARSVTATFDLQTFALSVTKAGAGSGSVSSVPAGIACGVDCSENYASGTSVTLSATASSGSVFAGWSGACSGSGTCAVTMDQARNVTATFDLQTFALSVTKAGAGSGSVSSVPAGIACGVDCSESYASGTSVTLTAAAASGSVFAGWSGACSGSGMCAVTMDQARSVTATFDIQTFALTVTKAGAGSGGVSSVPAGIDCGADCSESYASGTLVTLTAVPGLGSVFGGWSGDCAGVLLTCVVTIDQARNVTATFN